MQAKFVPPLLKWGAESALRQCSVTRRVRRIPGCLEKKWCLWRGEVLFLRSALQNALVRRRGIWYTAWQMKPLRKLEETQSAEGRTWELWERDGALSLMLDGLPVAASYGRGSEEAMAQIALSPITRAGQPCVMIAGAGLGYGVAAAMQALPRAKAKFIIAEPVGEIVEWNRAHGEHAELWQDERVVVEPESAVELCRKRTGSLHAILMRHTHAPCELSLADAQAFFNALKGGSLLAILLERPQKKLQGTLMRAGFDVSATPVPISAKGKQKRMHTLVLARRGRFVPFAERQKS